MVGGNAKEKDVPRTSGLSTLAVSCGRWRDNEHETQSRAFGTCWSADYRSVLLVWLNMHTTNVICYC